MRNATTPVASRPSNPVLPEFGALYPLAAHWSVDEPSPDDEVSSPETPSGKDGGLDEEVLDEAIFAGMVALR